MTRNMGGADRIVRGVIGLAILAAGVPKGAWWGWLGLIPLVTAFVAWCPGYVPFRISTCGTKKPAA